MASASYKLVQASALSPSGDMVLVNVGSKRHQFNLSHALLVQHSSYFREALPADTRTGFQHKIAVKDASPRAFDIFATWLNTGKIPQSVREWMPHVPKDLLGICDLEKSLLCLKTYVLADRLGAPAFLQIINNDYIDNNLTAPWLAEVIYAYAHIPHDRAILQMMVDTHCNGSILRSNFIDGEDELQFKLPIEFLLRVSDRYADLRHMTDCREEEPELVKCDYHMHASEEEREECRAQEIWERGYDEE